MRDELSLDISIDLLFFIDDLILCWICPDTFLRIVNIYNNIVIYTRLIQFLELNISTL